MKDRRFWLAVVSAVMAAQHNTGEAAPAAAPDAGREYSVRVHSSVAEEEAVVALFDDCRYADVIEAAAAAWPKLEAMPDRVLYCVAECYIRTGQARVAKTAFELLIAHSPQNQRYRAGLAYTLLYTGQVDKGLSMYRQVLQENRGMLTGAAEDAVALLSMGNTSGKGLFQIVIEISPDKQQYTQWYEKTLRMYRLANDIAAGQQPALSQQPDIPAKTERQSLHTQAVEMAQTGKYQQSLAVMAKLVKTDAQDQAALADYITILQQAGYNEQAVRVFEQHTAMTLPFSALRSVSTAYFQLKDYEQALAVLQPAIACGDKDALLWAGEMSLRCGNSAKAQGYYERLLTQNPNDYEVYFSRGMQYGVMKDFRQAAADLERARRLLPTSPNKAAQVMTLEHSLALAYMNCGQAQKAVATLANYTKTLPVEETIASDYILALGSSGQYELAIREGERLWSNYSAAPAAGLKSLAESYLRLGKQEQALGIYRYLAGPQLHDTAGLRLLAFQLLLDGRTAEGLGYYGQLLGTTRAAAEEAAADAATFIKTDKYIAGKLLFEQVLSKYPEPVYRQQYAEVLAEKKHNRAAYNQYQLLAAQPAGELDGLSGMARTAIALGDYAKSRKALDTITSKYGRSKAVAALAARSSENLADNSKVNQFSRVTYQGPQPKATAPQIKAENTSNIKSPVGPVPAAAEAISREEFIYEMAQIAETFLSAPVTNIEKFKIEFAYAMSTMTAKAMPLIPSDQRNEFTYEMAQLTSAIINDPKVDVKTAKAQFAQLTTKVVNRIDQVADVEKTSTVAVKPAGVSNSTGVAAQATPPGYVDPETYTNLMDDLLQVGDRSKHPDHRVNIDGEIRYHYAANSGSARFAEDASGFRLYLSANSKINKDWHIYSMFEGQQSIKNYNNKFELSRLYLDGKIGAARVKAGKFGYLMAEGNIYDSGFTGARFDFGDPVKYSLSYGKTNESKDTFVATARYSAVDYNLEAGMYDYRVDDGTNNHNTIWTIGGNYNFSNFSVGAMYLGASQKDANGDNDGYVLSLNYGNLRAYRPGTYGMFAKYYNQAQYTYIAHGMNGKGTAMQGMKGYGLGISYTLAKDLVASVEYYNLSDKVTGEKGKTVWSQVTKYF